MILLFVTTVATCLVWTSTTHAEAASLCGPFDSKQDDSKRDPAPVVGVEQAMNESGVSDPIGASDTSRRSGSAKGDIVGLPEDPSAPEATEPADEARESEALLALPKDGSGAIPTDFELGPGARVSQSFFSPVICSTVARITGPPGAALDQLVTLVPETAIVVRNDVYASAATEVESLALPAMADPYASLQYGLGATGVRAARGLSDGSGVRVALLDSTPDLGHRDLGEIELVALSDATAAVATTAVHGTLMAGVIRAVEGNGFGIAGMAPGADLIAIPVCAPSGAAGGHCTIYELLRGLDSAWQAEAQIINLSLTGPPNPLLERGMARLDELGVVVVAAAGNQGESEERFPAAYPSVVGVGAVDRQGRLFGRSNSGSWVELLAPGVEVLSTVPGSAFAFGNGTSLAAAHVSGLLAVLTAVTRDPKLARSELFRAALDPDARHSNPLGVSTGLLLPKACDVFARLGLDCEASRVALEHEP